MELPTRASGPPTRGVTWSSVLTLGALGALGVLAASSLSGCASATAPDSSVTVHLDATARAATGAPPPAPESSAVASALTPSDPTSRCAAHDRAACEALASQCRIGADSEPKWESVACAERERNACEAGSAAYCAKLAERYTSSTGDVGVAKSEVEAAKLLERACDGGAGMEPCIQMAYRYEQGDGVAKDPARAVAAFEGVCDEESGIFPQPCNALARHLAAGDGVAKDEARAARIYAATCSEGVCDLDALTELCADTSPRAKTTAGCVSVAHAYTLSVVYAPGPDPKKARGLLERACKRGDAAGCSELGAWYLEGRKWPGGGSVAEDAKRAAAYFAQACAAGDERACELP